MKLRSSVAGPDGQTALALAVCLKDFDFIKKLLARGADVNEKG